MKTPSFRTLALTLAGGLALPAASGFADTFGSGANTFTIDFANIGNPGNANDAGAGGGLYSGPYGGVSYAFRMGTYEISQDIMDKAIASGLLGGPPGSWSGSQPATNLSWYEAALFVNWMNTSTGHPEAYQVGPVSLLLWTSAEAWQAGGQNLFRNKDAYYFLPSETEWYKAAFHKNDGVTANYWDYATASNTAPVPVTSGTAAGTAVYNSLTSAPADVGADGGLSAYGTQGQNGNVMEWLESAFDGVNDVAGENRTVRGGSFNATETFIRSSAHNTSGVPTFRGNFIGFRVASVVPEPTSAALLASGLLLTLRRRHGKSAVSAIF